MAIKIYFHQVMPTNIVIAWRAKDLKQVLTPLVQNKVKEQTLGIFYIVINNFFVSTHIVD